MGSSLKRTPPPPFTCVSTKPGSSRCAAEVVAGGATATRVVAGNDVDDPAAVQQHGAALEEAVVAEHAAVDERGGHQTVSVTLRRCGGRSGSRPRAIGERVGEPVEALDQQQRLDRGMRADRRQRERARATCDAGQQDARPDADQLAGKRFDAGSRLVALARTRAPGIHGPRSADGTVPQFRAR